MFRLNHVKACKLWLAALVLMAALTWQCQAAVTISGGAFQDVDCSGGFNGGDMPLPGATFILTDASGNPVVDASNNPVPPQMGSTFSFTNLLIGTYRITEINPPGYSSVDAIPSGPDAVKITSDIIQVDAGVDGDYPDQNFLDSGCTLLVYQAYPGDSNGVNVGYAGYATLTDDLISSVPGVLQIIPQDDGEEPWQNFIRVYHNGIPAPTVTITSVTLRKTTPALIQCGNEFPQREFMQQGTSSIRLWWPLMYEVPGTTWTLTINYTANGTPMSDVWRWQVDATLESLKLTLELFHQLPFGTSQVPLVSDEELYPILQAKLDAAIDALAVSDLLLAGMILADFEMEVNNAWIASTPMYPLPSGVGTGIVQTAENPAACKLQVDAGYIADLYGLFQTAK